LLKRGILLRRQHAEVRQLDTRFAATEDEDAQDDLQRCGGRYGDQQAGDPADVPLTSWRRSRIDQVHCVAHQPGPTK
jgi:hypothetical protein